MTLIDFTLSDARRLYSSMGNPWAVKGLNEKLDQSTLFIGLAIMVYMSQ